MSTIKTNQLAHTANGASVYTLPTTDGSAGQVLKTDGSGNLSWVAQPTGISEIDTWFMTATINGTVEPISSNLSRYTNFGVNYLSANSGMSVTSGIWTFPTTGYWRIFFKFQGERQGGHQSAYQQLRISTSTDSGSSYNLAAIAEGTYYDNYNATRKTGGSASLVFDVTNVGTHKVKFHTLAEDNSGNGNLFVGHSSIGVTTFEFIKLTDT